MTEKEQIIKKAEDLLNVELLSIDGVRRLSITWHIHKHSIEILCDILNKPIPPHI
jgi:hypothetical protein